MNSTNRLFLFWRAIKTIAWCSLKNGPGPFTKPRRGRLLKIVFFLQATINSYAIYIVQYFSNTIKVSFVGNQLCWCFDYVKAQRALTKARENKAFDAGHGLMSCVKSKMITKNAFLYVIYISHSIGLLHISSHKVHSMYKTQYMYYKLILLIQTLS